MQVRCIITGPQDTPYEGGLFVFDVFFPAGYPNVPPLMVLETTGDGRARFNPNLYAGECTNSPAGTKQGCRGANKQGCRAEVKQGCRAEGETGRVGWVGELGDLDRDCDFNCDWHSRWVKGRLACCVGPGMRKMRLTAAHQACHAPERKSCA